MCDILHGDDQPWDWEQVLEDLDTDDLTTDYGSIAELLTNGAAGMAKSLIDEAMKIAPPKRSNFLCKLEPKYVAQLLALREAYQAGKLPSYVVARHIYEQVIIPRFGEIVSYDRFRTWMNENVISQISPVVNSHANANTRANTPERSNRPAQAGSRKSGTKSGQGTRTAMRATSRTTRSARKG